MTKRIFRSILGVSLAVLLASLVLIVGVLHGYFQDRVSGELESLAEYIAHGVEENGTDYLTEDLPGSYRITWVDADGTVLFDNRQDPEEMGNHAQREEIREALILGKGHGGPLFGHAFPADAVCGPAACRRNGAAGVQRPVFRLGPGTAGAAAGGADDAAGLHPGHGAGFPGGAAAGGAHQRHRPQ